ncbi:MAG: PEGA domain-containing protein [Petrimonas sp.]|jgi:hypothetical protein|uniref:PEGA domain-containing protein n=1 Tax=Petrimonas TaxID=307628 RepID=UPI000E9D26F8|nr:PEGA domain-containing protein [Petrimonas sp.]NLU29915.1 PEGA domain-containing protein [Bacteroidales bacterium]BBD46337.1 PEGA domain protein [Petrimonas sp. IBARAKI]HBF96536.1 PEGA domain-containing protein [Porphyromonadaceae bacterium]MDD3541561.1 PEGA domain-containing protein [Petrimonas sp.]
MKKTKLLSKAISLMLAGAILFASCSSSTLIQSSPSGAKVYLNGEYAGVTPYTHTDTKIVGSSTQVRLEKEGYETLNTAFSRNEDADVGAIIGGIFFLFPFLWTMKYKPVRTYELVPSGNASLTGSDNITTAQKGLVKDANGNEYISGVLKD